MDDVVDDADELGHDNIEDGDMVCWQPSKQNSSPPPPLSDNLVLVDTSLSPEITRMFMRGLSKIECHVATVI